MAAAVGLQGPQGGGTEEGVLGRVSRRGRLSRGLRGEQYLEGRGRGRERQVVSWGSSRGPRPTPRVVFQNSQRYESRQVMLVR